MEHGMKKIFLSICAMFLFLSACAPAPQGKYTLDPNPANFVRVVDNPYYPLTPGSRWVYEAAIPNGGSERIEVEVLQETRQVMGVEATVVRDTVTVDGQVVEDTRDWYAQDADGNVWYLGEEVDNYENGQIVDHSGSWEWGVDGALPGIIMWADPAAHLNEEYYQEYLQGEAEDQGQVLSVDESVTVPFGSYENVVQTYDFSALDPNITSHKFYAAGIGTIKEIELSNREEVLLINFTPGSD
jgi:hypothetical protein